MTQPRPLVTVLREQLAAERERTAKWRNALLLADKRLAGVRTERNELARRVEVVQKAWSYLRNENVTGESRVCMHEIDTAVTGDLPAHPAVPNAVHLYNSGYLAGHHDTVEATFVDIYQSDMDTYHTDVVSELVGDLPESTDTAMVREIRALLIEKGCTCDPPRSARNCLACKVLDVISRLPTPPPCSRCTELSGLLDELKKAWYDENEGFGFKVDSLLTRYEETKP